VIHRVSLFSVVVEQKIKNIMKFELLPNEIFIECFEYLDTLDIFYSFDQLNNRLNKLIRNIPLHINCQHVRKAKFSQFCRQSSSSPQITQNISSLNLSNKDTCGQIKLFLSSFPLKKYSDLHSLRLTHVEEENVFPLQSMLPLCSTLHTFHLISSQIDEDAILSALPMSNLQNLSITSLRYFLKHIQRPTIITHLTLFNCSLDQLFYKLFQYAPMLEYLNIESISKYNRSIKMMDRYNAIHLKQLIIGQFKHRFEDFENFVKQIPNLENLTISADRDIDMCDANNWEILITSSLPYLSLFKFKFDSHRGSDDVVIFIFEQFQTHFWVKQHQWYTQLFCQNRSFCIHTIPYLSNSFKLEFNLRRSLEKLANVSNTFDKVTYLTLCREQIREQCVYHFPNVTSLKINISEQQVMNSSIAKSLKIIINLSNLKHLDISTYQRLILSGELLLILKQSTQLSSLTIDPKDLTLLYSDKELCEYLNKMIKKLNIFKHDHSPFDDLNQLKIFSRIFSNIDQLRCTINQPQRILFLLCRLSKLSSMYVYLPSILDRVHFRYLLEKDADTLKFMFSVKDLYANAAELYIWIDENLE
jgi:hypothetical protein